MVKFKPYRASRGWRGLAVIGLLSAGAIVAWPFHKPEQAVEIDNRVPVRIASARPAPDADLVAAYGIVRPDREAKLAFKIGGMIRAITVDEGDRVTKGQVLAELDTREIDSQAAQAALAVEKASRDVARLAPLAEKGFASTQRMEDARTALDAARAGQRAVEFDRSLSHIIAPADGVVLMRHAQSREMVAPGAPIVTVSSGSDGFVLKSGLSDRDVARVKIGDAATIRLDAFDRTAMKGQITRIAAESDPRSGTFEVEIRFIDPVHPLISGFMGQAHIQASIAGPNANAVSIPVSAILEGYGAQASVFLVNAQTGAVERRRLSVGKLSGDQIIVTGGLPEDSVIVTDGAPYLRDGAEVRITEDIAAIQ